MRIVHIITGLRSEGTQNVLFRLLRAQDSSRWNNIVISLTEKGVIGAKLEEQGIEVHSLGMRPGNLSVRRFQKLVGLLRSKEPDIVQTWLYHANLVGGIAAKLAGAGPVIWNLRHSELDPGIDKASTIAIARVSRLLSSILPAKIICCSKATYETHSDLGYAPSRMVVIPNGFDIEGFQHVPGSSHALRTTLGIPMEHKLIGMAARFHPQKDHQTFVLAARNLINRHPDVDFVFCGQDMDSANAALVSMINAVGLREHFHLMGLQTDMPKMYSAWDVSTLSSSSGEGFPNVVAESMACGALMVTTDVGDAAEIVGSTGWVVPPGDVEALVGAWLEALAMGASDKAERIRHARERIQTKYSLHLMVQRYEALYEEALSA